MDLILQATGGLMGHTGEPGGPPIKSAPPVADITPASTPRYGITAALDGARAHRARGSSVEVAMLDAVVSLYSDIAANVLTDGQQYGKFGSGHPDLVPYQAFPAKDGYFIVACLTNAFFKRLCAALGREDLLADPRFATNDLAREAPRRDRRRCCSDIFRTRDRASTGSRCSRRTTSPPAA